MRSVFPLKFKKAEVTPIYKKAHKWKKKTTDL